MKYAINFNLRGKENKISVDYQKISIYVVIRR